MLPDPLHPAVVHLPIALAVLLPLLSLASLLAIRTGWLPQRAWSGVVLLAGLPGSTLAMRPSEFSQDQQVLPHGARVTLIDQSRRN